MVKAQWLAVIPMIAAVFGCSESDKPSGVPDASAPRTDASGGGGGQGSPDAISDTSATDREPDVATVDSGPNPIMDLSHPVEPGDPGKGDVAFELRTDKAVRPISSLIYGMNQPSEPARNRWALTRQGGNRLTGYNWENNASNAGADWCYVNDGYLDSRETPANAVKTFIDGARAMKAVALVTVPIGPYVAADRCGWMVNNRCENSSREEPADSGNWVCIPDADVRKTPNYLATRFKANKAIKGAAFAFPPDDNDGAVHQDEFVAWLKGYASDTPVLLSMDNEPDLWHATHPEVFPNAITYDDVVTRNIEFAKACKGVWPDVPVLGYVGYGWAGFTGLSGAPDSKAKGDFVDYYLSKMKEAEAQAGKRLVEYLDLHWYPEARDRYDPNNKNVGTRVTDGGQNSTSDAVGNARMQAPRSLWDPSYKEQSWIGYWNNEIRFIPRMLEKIQARYPGTKLAVSEWNYGGGGHITGAIATADVLGIFGRDGVHLAANWNMDDEKHSDFLFAGFRVFRNYNGNGDAFGDTSISATTTDVEGTSVYASLDWNTPSRVIIVAINKTQTQRIASVRLAHPTRFSKLETYQLTAQSAELSPSAVVASVATNAFRYELPKLSVSVLVAKP